MRVSELLWMPRNRTPPDAYLLSKVSTLYYLQNHTQHDIAKRLGVSRSTISRLLQDAHDHGVVQIKVVPPRQIYLELEERLEQRFGLDLAQVVSVERDGSDLLQQLGDAAAAYLARTVGQNLSLGLAWGTTLQSMVRAVSPMHTVGVRVVQTLGGIGPPDTESYASALVRRLARALEAPAILLPAPGVVPTRAVRDALTQDPHVKAALQELDSLDVVFVGIGSLTSNTVLNDGISLPREAHAELVAAGAVGDIALRFLDANGNTVVSSLEDRVLGVSVDQLRRTPRVVGVAGGRSKVQAIRAALRADLLDVLITDVATAEALMRTPRK
jgi:Transcriptional regulator, contains sigma factor-related N-terminal domain